MDSIFVLGLILVGFLNDFYVIAADHCDVKTDEHLLKPKIDLNISLEEPDNCSISYMTILKTLSNPVVDDDCKIRGFHLADNRVGPYCIPEIGNLEKDELFSINAESHREEAEKLLHVLLDCVSFEDFKNAALYYKTKVNPLLFSYVFSSAIINRRDTVAFSAPTLLQTQPDLLFSNNIIQKATQRVLKEETKALRKYEGRTEDFRKFNDDHEMPQYSRSKQIFDETRNNKNFRYSTSIPKEMTPIPQNMSLISEVESEETEESEELEKVYYGQPRKPGNRKRFEVKIKKLPLINFDKRQDVEILKSRFTGNYKNPEHRLSYFREDISINSHHSHWHKIYTMDLPPNDSIIKDRKGELFYYMHNQMLRRYDAARIADRLPYVKPLEIKKSGTIIDEGYYPHLTVNNGIHYSGRSKSMKLRDVHYAGGIIKVADLENSINKVKKGIKKKYLMNDDKIKIYLDEESGINLLGAVIESSKEATQKKKLNYGDIHNKGHLLLSFIHDAKQEFNAPGGVMLSTETALRDPVFWRWHKMIDDIFSYHKDQLPPYKNDQLTWKKVEIKDIVIKTDNSDKESYKPNTLHTYFKNRELEIENGLDLKSYNPVRIPVKHIDHLPFNYAIKIHNSFKRNAYGHVRIFISPKYTQDKKLATDEQLRQHSIEMDRFTIKLNPRTNEIVRHSSESAVTMAPNKQWESLSKHNVEFSKSHEAGGLCGCGWPSHLLVPKGKKDGIEYVLFVMISDWVKERVSKSKVEATCGNSLTMCGLLHEKFPDKRAMGFPLDRPFHGQENWFKRPNMIKKDIIIYHIHNEGLVNLHNSEEDVSEED